MINSISGMDTLWVLLSAFLVFFMHAGFAMLEAGFTQAKNAVNIIIKNFASVSLGTLAFFFVGFALMFGSGNGFWGQEYFGLSGLEASWGNLPSLAFFLFQAMFAATAATIVSGALAERTKFGGYMLFSILITGILYPIAGHWIWGGGWLADYGFLDFAGSTVVHSVGGWSALAGVMIVGPRLNRFKKGFDQKRFSGHSIPLGALGVMVLWFGWFGFNAGSQLAAEGAENAITLSKIVLNTQLAASAGALAAFFMGWIRTGYAKAGFMLNGVLGGLVAITASCAFVSPASSLVIGLVGGLVMMFIAELMEKMGLDDAVGAVPVHLGAGIWGTLALGLFSESSGLFYGHGWSTLGIQAVGILAVGAFIFFTSWIVLKIIDRMIGLRASEEEERAGLDLKHGQAAYPDFLSQ